MINRSLALTSLLLSVGLNHATAQPAEFVWADRATGLNEIGILALRDVCGGPQEIERLIARKAGEHGASYYRIVEMTENEGNDNWYARAILYV